MFGRIIQSIDHVYQKTDWIIIMKMLFMYFILSFSSSKYQSVNGSDMVGELHMQMNDLKTELNLLSQKFHEEKSKVNFLPKQLVNKEKNIQNIHLYIMKYEINSYISM